MRARLVLVAVLLVAACTDGASRAPASRPALSTAPDAATPLRRPWATPSLAPGAPCPVSAVSRRPDPGLGPLWGDGPARPGALEPGPLLRYAPPGDPRWQDTDFGGGKVLWAVDPSVRSVVLIRGRQVDGSHELRFEDPAVPELLIEPDDPEGQPGGWRDYPSYTRVRAPGCYAYQVDTADGTTVIVFRAEGQDAA